ncbi:hypothetical protein ACJMK2_024465 [Sinanodonta woodiana]|uniref:Uncharacterized protein n=1 Tax=Sinanodonta woodiana TaxID=1069815 RepID=A0ABD3XH68_SINWO
MTSTGHFIFFLVLAVGCGPYGLQGFECHIARHPITITVDTMYLVKFTWDCTLMSNESILSIVWLKEDTCIAKFAYGTFQPCTSYKGRVEQYERYGISIKNTSRNDSGYYKAAILLEGNNDEYVPCQRIYLPVLPDHRPVLQDANLPFASGEQSSECEQHGPSNLVIGLICGILPLTVVIGLGGALWYFRRKRTYCNDTENENMPPELCSLQVSC